MYINDETLKAIDRYAKSAAWKHGITDVNTIRDIASEARLAAVVAVTKYDKRRDKKRRGIAHFARIHASFAAKLAAKEQAKHRNQHLTNRREL